MRRLNPLVLACAVIILTCCLHGQYTKAEEISSTEASPNPLPKKTPVKAPAKKTPNKAPAKKKMGKVVKFVSKVLNFKKVAKILKDLVKNRFDKFFEKKDQCEKKTNKDAVSAHLYDSPIKPFGYPRVDELKYGITMLHPGVSLSQIDKKHKNAVIAGSRDFYFVGKGNELINFCKCFQKYDVIGQTLADDGHWRNNTGHIKLQLENVQSWTAGNKDPNLFDMIFKITLDRIIKELDVKAKIKELTGIGRSNEESGSYTRKWLGDSSKLETKLANLKGNFEKWRAWMPEKPEILDGVEKILAEANLTPKQVFDKFLAFVNEKRVEDKPKVWQQGKNVEKDQVIIAVLTAYTKPPNNLRATYNFGESKIKMNDVGEAIAKLLNIKY